MTTKLAADLKPGDVVDLTAIHPYSFPIRTVDRIEWHPRGIPEQAVIVHWVEPVGFHNTIRADKELTIR